MVKLSWMTYEREAASKPKLPRDTRMQNGMVVTQSLSGSTNMHPVVTVFASTKDTCLASTMKIFHILLTLPTITMLPKTFMLVILRSMEIRVKRINIMENNTLVSATTNGLAIWQPTTTPPLQSNGKLHIVLLSSTKTHILRGLLVVSVRGRRSKPVRMLARVNTSFLSCFDAKFIHICKNKCFGYFITVMN